MINRRNVGIRTVYLNNLADGITDGVFVVFHGSDFISLSKHIIGSVYVFSMQAWLLSLLTTVNIRKICSYHIWHWNRFLNAYGHQKYLAFSTTLKEIVMVWSIKNCKIMSKYLKFYSQGSYRQLSSARKQQQWGKSKRNNHHQQKSREQWQ